MVLEAEQGMAGEKERQFDLYGQRIVFWWFVFLWEKRIAGGILLCRSSSPRKPPPHGNKSS
jgi:hypothetical protein